MVRDTARTAPTWALVSGLTRGQLDASAADGTQRPFGFDYRQPCIAYDALPKDGTKSPTIRIRCITTDGALHALPPTLTSRTVAPRAARSERAGIGVDGVTVAGGTIYVGVDFFAGRHVKWPVLALQGSRWIATSLGADSSWDAQGSLYTIAGEPWAIQFDQRNGSGGIQTRLIVRGLLADGTSITVGEPLIRNARLLGPL